MTMSRVEVITSVERRRRWSREAKERLVAASFEPGVSVSEIARSAGIPVSQLFRWRKDLCVRAEASVPQFVPVDIVPAPVPGSTDAEAPTSTTSLVRRRKSQGIIEIDLGGGRRIRVDCDVDADALRRVLDALGDR